ncbi:MAG: DNA polymerase III subunit beta [Erysipelotrichaceae bacterium]|nr:DNA polymerase III subunit beta [Erysipelotrichaceae bacterium]
MNFKIRKKEFLDSISNAVRAISSTTPLPALSGIKFEAKENSLVVISSDSNISIRTIIKNTEKDTDILTVNETGEVIIDARYILEIVRKIDSPFINFEIIDGTLVKIYGANSEFKINGMKGSEYPEINFSVSDNAFSIKTEAFFEIVNQTAFACAETDTRPILTGVNFKAKEGILTINATDSYRLASKKVEIDSDLEFSITIPNKHLSLIYHSLANVDDVMIVIDNQKISFVFNNTIVQTRLLDDVFPDTSKLIPLSFTQVLEIKAKELANAIDRTSFIKSDGKNIVKLTITAEEIDITSSNQIGSSYENVKLISFEGDPFEISCSGKYLMDAIKAIGSENITISFSGELRPLIITNKEDNSVVQLISPVRTYK